MPIAERHDPPGLAHEAGAWLRLDVTDRQLAILRHTFPHLDSYEHDHPDCRNETATLACEPTAEMATADLAQHVRRGNPLERMAALTAAPSRLWHPGPYGSADLLRLATFSRRRTRADDRGRARHRR